MNSSGSDAAIDSDGVTCDDRSFRQLELVHKQLTKKDITVLSTENTTDKPTSTDSQYAVNSTSIHVPTATTTVPTVVNYHVITDPMVYVDAAVGDSSTRAIRINDDENTLPEVL